ncbi:Hsp20/alpha crystallin family protein [Actinoplanes sp. NEAU-A12]|uniref:Hsp20/alpha crystallin family protein n=1 Tax=Actinoplanes sandaracinus TaxID=3045177 RepID=A0ABT6WTW0_9ACTN|nr:Hsp20/alpha crystallin family protein [Actinoplanes sandaracinus]MDI6103055.1 Hsp20/alpha crystallin family protein [Actinoplanes sandaracinus]
MTLPVLRPHPLAPARNGHQADPLRELAQLQQHMNQLFTSLLGSDPLSTTAGTWTPLADITEVDDAYLVEIDVPGVDRKHVTVEVTGTQLRVSGEIVEKEKVGWLRHRTRRVGQFAHHTLLPADIDSDHISADLADGVLTVRVPKTETARPRRITVNAG